MYINKVKLKLIVLSQKKREEQKMNSMDENSVVNILTICLSIMIFLLMILIIVYIILKVKQRTDVKQSQSNNNNNVARKDNNKIKKRKVDNK